MGETQYVVITLSTLAFIFLLFKFLKHKKRINLPPTPPSLPVIGHLHLITQPVHRLLQQLSSKYGPIYALRFGSRPVLVISSPAAAQECFTKHDVLLANRPRLLSGKYLYYDHTAMGAAPYGKLWRDISRVTTLELFSTTRLNAYMGVRQDEVRSLVKYLFRDSCQGLSQVELRSGFQGLSFNIITRILAGKRFYGTEVEDFDKASNFRDVIREISEASGASNTADFIPVLKWIDFQGVEKWLLKLQSKSDGFSQSLIDERRSKGRNSSSDGGNAKTFIDAMLSLQESEPEYYTDDVIKGTVLTLLLAGTDTSAVVIEWALSLLLNHPDVLERARAEVDEYIGDTRLVEETDLPKLYYIRSIVNETLRLFPAAPLLVPHEPSEDCTIGGFNVSLGTMVLVNAWAIHRDPQSWDDPLSFKPERFTKVENKEYKFIPFGMGRRQCPGAGLANRVVGLTLATLIQCFEWERVSEELVDLSEGKGLTMPKDKPLEAMCKVRQNVIHILTEL